VFQDLLRDDAAEQVQLVIPTPLFPTYSDAQQRWLINVRGFAELALARQ